MGIDRSNIRIVAHLYFAQSLEAYSQEVGRAGRDDLPSDCFLFLCNSDLAVSLILPASYSIHSSLTCSSDLHRFWKGSSEATPAQSRPSSRGSPTCAASDLTQATRVSPPSRFISKSRS